MGTGIQALPGLKQTLESLNLDAEIILTEHPGHAVQLARKAAAQGSPVIAAAGGDGTVNEVINGLMQAQKENHCSSSLGVIPIGRGNDFAFGMHIPSDMESACRTLAQGHHKKIDIGLVSGGDFPNGRYFGNGIGVGFDAVVGFEAAKLKLLRGFLSYLVAAVKTIFLYYRAPLVRLTLPTQELELKALMISVMNGRRMGGSFHMAPDALNDDKLLDICIAPEVSRMRIFGLIGHFMKGTQAGQPEIEILRSDRLSIRATSGTLPAHADGETLCTAGSELEIELLPNQLDLLFLEEETPA